MQVREFRDTLKTELKDIYSGEEATAIFKILLEDLLGWSRQDALTRSSEELTAENLDALTSALEELKMNKPVQYVTGRAHFFGHSFCVNQHTLIPRQETEELVDWICQDHDEDKKYKIIDFCTGSGCIGISLTYCFRNSTVKLVDNSHEALKIAARNAKTILEGIDCKKDHLQSSGGNFQDNTYNRMIFQEEDFLAKEKMTDHYDIIVMNPPYVTLQEKNEMHANVLEHEPHQALFVPEEDPLLFYRKLFELAQRQQKAKIYLEVNQYLAKQTEELAQTMGYATELKKDLNNNWRMMKAWLS